MGFGPHYPSRMESFHGLDEHPNGIPPEEKPPKHTFPVDCPECNGSGNQYEEGVPYEHEPVPCDLCEGWGEVDFAGKVRHVLQKIIQTRPFG